MGNAPLEARVAGVSPTTTSTGTPAVTREEPEYGFHGLWLGLGLAREQ